MAASLIEPIGLIGCLAIADTLFRFAPQHPEGRATLARTLAGMALILGLPLVLLTQLVLVPLVAPWPNMPGELALRLALLSACLGAFIELPLAFWRLSEQPLRFTAFVIGRSLAQATLLIGGLKAGFGVDGVLIGNAGDRWAGHPAALAADAEPRTAGDRAGRARGPYPLRPPDPRRWAGHVRAGRDGSLVPGRQGRPCRPCALRAGHQAGHGAGPGHPAICLWWYPRRLAVLRGPDGPQETARYWLAGLALLCLGALVLMALARLFVLGIFPPAYHGVLAYLPWLFALVLMNELASLSNGPAYARASGWHVLRVNGAGAIMALALYLLLIPAFGLAGAMAATAFGQATRLVLFWADRGLVRASPIAWRWRCS